MMSKNLQRYYTLKCLIRDLLSNVFVSPKFWLAKVFDLSRGPGNETSTNIVWYLYSFRALFVLYEAVFLVMSWFFYLPCLGPPLMTFLFKRWFSNFKYFLSNITSCAFFICGSRISNIEGMPHSFSLYIKWAARTRWYHKLIRLRARETF